MTDPKFNASRVAIEPSKLTLDKGFIVEVYDHCNNDPNKHLMITSVLKCKSITIKIDREKNTLILFPDYDKL